MNLEELAWRTLVLATANGVFLWLAIKLFDFGNERNKLPAAIVWSIPFSLLVHLHMKFGGAYGIPPFLIMALLVFYGLLVKWYDLEFGQTIKVVVVTLGLDVGAYIALTRIGILPPFGTAAVVFQPLLA